MDEEQLAHKIFPDKERKKPTHRRQLDEELDGLDDKEVMETTAKGLKEAKAAEY